MFVGGRLHLGTGSAGRFEPLRLSLGVLMAKVLYTAQAHVTGGRDGHGRTADGQLEVDLRMPKEMGGAGGGTHPGGLVAVGYAARFESALAVVPRRPHTHPGA